MFTNKSILHKRYQYPYGTNISVSILNYNNLSKYRKVDLSPRMKRSHQIYFDEFLHIALATWNLYCHNRIFKLPVFHSNLPIFDSSFQVLQLRSWSKVDFKVILFTSLENFLWVSIVPIFSWKGKYFIKALCSLLLIEFCAVTAIAVAQVKRNNSVCAKYDEPIRTKASTIWTNHLSSPKGRDLWRESAIVTGQWHNHKYFDTWPTFLER